MLEFLLHFFILTYKVARFETFWVIFTVLTKTFILNKRYPIFYNNLIKLNIKLKFLSKFLLKKFKVYKIKINKKKINSYPIFINLNMIFIKFYECSIIISLFTVVFPSYSLLLYPPINN